MELVSKLDEIMENRNISLVSLARRTGLAKMTIYNAQVGRRVNLYTALKIAKALNTPLTSIWQLENKEKVA
jgi:DNA-binding XRE family transcriptional regulator